MQKKSLLVALFCGALCLTGCLKNEESASVALVRGAKAEELKSLAALNNAKAAAEAVYAQAELTVANAEAELRKAQANLVNAMAETEKVRAELLKVQVALQEVKVDEERVELQKKEAELEKLLAQVEAAKAQAEAEKQAWVNMMENLLAQAEIDAINNAKRILEAEEKLEEYVLTLEKAHADSAKKAANKYFKALADVQDLQKQQLQVKATKALVEAGALQVRDAIHYEMAQIDEQIAEKQARIDYLKEYQTMTPEEVEAELEEAWKTLNDAYAAYLDASGAVTDAQKSFNDAEKVKSTYVDAWGNKFGTVVKSVLAELPTDTEYAEYQYGNKKYVFVDEETGVIYNAAVTFDKSGEVVDIIPLWTASAPGKEQVKEEYLIPEVIEGIKTRTLPTPAAAAGILNIKTRTYYPAKIEFENIQDIFDAYKEYQEEVVLPEFDEKVAEFTEGQKEKIEARIEGWEADKVAFEDYIANPTRKAMVEKAEKALEDSIANANKTYDAKNKALKAYRDYMINTYDVDRTFFEKRHDAASALTNADADSVTWQGYLDDAKDYVEEMYDALVEAELYAHEALGAYQKAQEDLANFWNRDKVNAARAKFNESFIWEEGVSESSDTVWTADGLFNTEVAGGPYSTHAEKVAAKVDSTKAGSTQIAVFASQKAMKDAEEDLRDAKWMKAYWTGYGDEEEAAEYDVDALQEAYDAAVSAYNTDVISAAKAAAITKAATDPEDLQEALDTAEGEYLAAVADLYPGGPYDEDDVPTTWDEFVAAVKDTLEESATKSIDISLNFYPRQITVAELTLDREEIPQGATAAQVKASEEYTTAQKAAWLAHQHTVKTNALAKAEKDLLNHLAYHMNVKPEEIETTVDEHADSLYVAWQKAKDTGATVMEKTFNALKKVYDSRANQERRRPYENQFYWLNANYQVDPEYQYISGYEWDPENETYVLVKSYVRSRTIKIDGEDVVVPRRRGSLAGRIEIAEAILADEEKFAENCRKQYVNSHADPYVAYDEMCTKIAEATENLAKFKAVETAYAATVEYRNTTHAALVEAQIEEVVAKVDYTDAKEAYNALKDIQNEGIWVYAPGKGANKDGFRKIPIAKAIEDLEGDVDAYKTGVSALFKIAVAVQNQIDNVIDGKKVTIDELQSAYNKLQDIDRELPDGNIAELNFTKKVLEETLKAGKVGLQIIIDAFDEELAVLDEKIEVYTALVNTYKAIMNAYLGIVEESEGETGPLDGEGEGDDEE